MDYKVLITTSGAGRMLGNLTKQTNSALVRVGRKPAISYIIETYPLETKFVITIGYLGYQVEDFLRLAYPERHFEFIEVDKYDGDGSSLGYSMLAAKDRLQCPFIFHASDTIVTMVPPPPDKNWVGVYRGEDASQYTSWQVGGDGGLILKEKGATDFDHIHIGIIGVKDYGDYWDKLAALYKDNPHDGSLNDCAPIVRMIEGGKNFKPLEFPLWYDVGNTAALEHTRQNISDSFSNLHKTDEAIFLFDNFVIKFFADEKLAQNRIARAKLLGNLVPKVEGESKNFYRYELVKGDLYSKVANPDDFSRFLGWAKKNLWLPAKGVPGAEFKKVCLAFYKDKTEQRVKRFLEANSIKDEASIINGERVPAVAEMLQKIDWEWLTTGVPSQFHGDFILENIIKTADGYKLIDWRQDFGGLLNAGDMYYDLAKLNHNLAVNHEIVDKNLFYTKFNKDGSIECDILMRSMLADCRRVFVDFLNAGGYDKKKVGTLTGIVWLNMSPLHHHPFNIFLFYFGKYHLWRALRPALEIKK